MKKFFLLLSILLLFCGCCNVRVSHKGDMDFMTIENSCWKIFGAIPLVSGHPEYPNGWHQSWFRNQATLQDNMNLIDREVANGNYASFSNLVSFRSEEEILFFLIVRTTYHTSAELNKYPQ